MKKAAISWLFDSNNAYFNKILSLKKNRVKNSDETVKNVIFKDLKQNLPFLYDTIKSSGLKMPDLDLDLSSLGFSDLDWTLSSFFGKDLDLDLSSIFPDLAIVC